MLIKSNENDNNPTSSESLCVAPHLYPETDILRPELIERYEGYGRMFQQLFAKQPIAAEFVIYNVVEGRHPADDERFDAYLVTGSKADPSVPTRGSRP